ncbi:MAG TPA: hypothetical protein PLP17_03145, partial [Oligoflexia bacterium]|nr:hypothetical protein [Oligoflexia bacterium]
FRRPALVGRLPVNKAVRNDSGVAQLLAFVSPQEHERRNLPAGSDAGEAAPVMLAASRKPFWKRETKDWLGELAVVESAYASQLTQRLSGGLGELWPPDDQEEDLSLRETSDRARPDVERGFLHVLQDLEFGEEICPAFSAAMNSRGVSPGLLGMDSPSCPEKINRGFGRHLGREVNFKEFFRGYEQLMQFGYPAAEAIEQTVRAEVAEQFYSFFDQLVRQSHGAAGALLGADSSLVTLRSGNEIARLLAQLRYLGSQIALSKIVQKMNSAAALSTSNRDEFLERTRELQAKQVLHAEADQGQTGTNNEFSLSAAYLPVPLEFGSTLGKLQAGAMKNVLYRENHLIDPLVERSNKLIQVTYAATRGIFQAAARRYDTENVRLTGKFYLVTQPWHIDRRIDWTGPWRTLGAQFDSADLETEEALLRRRANGLFVFPRDPWAMIEPLNPLPVNLPFAGALSGLSNTLQPVMSFIEGTVLDSIADALNWIPRLGRVAVRIPRFPVARPDAYPNTQEFNPDNATGELRSFSDYLSEQRAFRDRHPNPSFN